MKTNQTTNEILGTPWLTPWQKRWLILAAALAGAAIATGLLKWLEARRVARLAAAQRGDDNAGQ